MTSDRLSALEAAYLELEQMGVPIQVGSIGIFEAGPLLDEHGALRLAELRTRVESRLHLLPRLRQRLAEVPLGLGRPTWVDDTSFDITQHVLAVPLWAPHDEQALRELAAELLMRPLDPSLPMWQMVFVTGLQGGRVGLVERATHLLVDGVSGVDLATVLLDLERSPAPTASPPWRPEPGPDPARTLRDAMVDQATTPLRLGAAALRALRDPRALARRLGVLGTALMGAESEGLRAPASSLNRPLGGRRRILWVRQHLDEVKRAGKARGATVNDVVLSAVAGGLRTLLLARGEELPADLALKVLVPVSLRAGDERGTLGNRVGGLFLTLPVGIGDPEARLDAVVAEARSLKEHHEAEASEVLLAAADLLPPLAIGPVVSLLDHQPFVNLVVTNIPGPDVPLYAMGSELLEAFPVVPLAGNLTLGVAVLSYRGALTIGITADTRSCPDAETFASGLEHAFVELGAHWAPTVTHRAG